MNQKHALKASFFLLLILYLPCNAGQKTVSIFGKVQEQFFNSINFGKFLIQIPSDGVAFLSRASTKNIKRLIIGLKNIKFSYGDFSPVDQECATIPQNDQNIADKVVSSKLVQKNQYPEWTINRLIKYVKPVTAIEGEKILQCNIECIDNNNLKIKNEIESAFDNINKNIFDNTTNYIIKNLCLDSKITEFKQEITTLNRCIENQAQKIDEKNSESYFLTKKQTEEIYEIKNCVDSIVLEQENQKKLNQETLTLIKDLENKIQINKQIIIDQNVLRKKKKKIKKENALIEDEKKILEYIAKNRLKKMSEVEIKPKNSSSSNLPYKFFYLSTTSFASKKSQFEHLEFKKLLQLILNINQKIDSCFIISSLIPRITEINKNSKQCDIYNILKEYEPNKNTFKLDLAYNAACMKQIINRRELIPSKEITANITNEKPLIEN